MRLAALAFFVIIAVVPSAHSEDSQLTPRGDHHQHLLSPAGAALMNNPSRHVTVPDAIAQLLRAHEAAWNDPARLTALFTADAVTLRDFDPIWLRGPAEVAGHVGRRFVRPYYFTPIAFLGDEQRARLAAYYSRGEGAERKHIGSVLLEFERDASKTWHIAMEHMQFPGPLHHEPLDGARLVALLDEAHIERAAVLSIAYWFDSPFFQLARSAQAVDAENDWTAEQSARFPGRLVPFCSLNPISDSALANLAHCVKDGRFRGLKVHFANAEVDLLNPEHVRRVSAVFTAAARAKYAIVAHTRTGPDYGAAQARVVIEKLLPAAPGVPVQIAHLWGGENFAPEALAVFAQACAAKERGTSRLYFDVSDAALVAKAPEQAQRVASRIRQIGLEHIVYGSDAAYEPHPGPRASWRAFHEGLPLTEAEFARIASNLAPYLRD